MNGLLFAGWLMLGAIAPFTERGTTDFDTVLGILNSGGVWENVEGGWGYRPFEKNGWRPLTEGRWIYTDFGWYWKGEASNSWVTDHYGIWKCGSDAVWRWFPGPEWVAMGVDWRATATHFGWRISPVNKMGDFEETEEARVAKPEEWVWVPREKFGDPIEPRSLVVGAAGKSILEESAPLTHLWMTYREIQRLGPSPIDYPKGLPPKSAAMVAESEKVSPYVIMTLPTYWTPLPPDARAEQIYVYRPKFYQDRDGIQRRIRIWMNPEERKVASEKVNQTLIPKPVETNAAPVIPEKPVEKKVPEKKEPEEKKKSTFRSR